MIKIIMGFWILVVGWLILHEPVIVEPVAEEPTVQLNRPVSTVHTINAEMNAMRVGRDNCITNRNISVQEQIKRVNDILGTPNEPEKGLQ